METLVHMERAEPKKHIVASSGALYTVVLVLVIGTIAAAYNIGGRFDLPQVYVQALLYAFLLMFGYLIYRFRLLSFRYTLTDRMLRVDRILGNRERTDAHIHLSDVLEIRPYAGIRSTLPKRCAALYFGKKRDALCVIYRRDGKRGALLLSPTDTLREKLLKQWKSAIQS